MYNRLPSLLGGLTVTIQLLPFLNHPKQLKKKKKRIKRLKTAIRGRFFYINRLADLKRCSVYVKRRWLSLLKRIWPKFREAYSLRRVSQHQRMVK
jgi:hypothetical protein